MGMLTTADRQFLIRWCRARRVKWFAAVASDGGPAVLLIADTGPRVPMRVAFAPDGLRLETETGEVLAAASDLPALLDALDAGIADLPSRVATFRASVEFLLPVRRDRPVAAARRRVSVLA
jgi:hypothetical protein